MSSELLREAQDPNTTADRLMQIAQSSRETWEAVAVHPAAYSGLLDWLQEHGDDAVRAAIARRGIGHLPPPPPPPADAVAASTASIPAPPAAPSPAPAPAAAPAETAATQTGGGNSGGSANAVRVGGVLVLLVALVAGGWFGVQALTGDDDKDEPQTVGTDLRDNGDDDVSGDRGDGASGEFCDLVRQTQGLKLSEISTGGVGDTDLDDLTAKLDKVRDVYRELEDVAPSDLKGDVATVADFFENLGDMYSSGHVGVGSSGSVDSAEFSRAATRLSQYYTEHCM